MTSNERETRPYVVIGRYAEHGRTRVTIQCPFCGKITEAYVWSLASRGKRCECGTLFNKAGYATQLSKSRQKDQQ